jgi:hypothetical protein
MRGFTTNFLVFLLGAAAGSLTAWRLLKGKYEQIAQEEIDSVKEVFSKKSPSEAEENGGAREKADMAKEKASVTEYAARIRENGYTNYSNIGFDKKEEADVKPDEPHVISPEEFGEIEDYEKIGFTYYADMVLADEDNKSVPPDEIKDMLGTEALNSFGEYEDDSVFVRNDRLKCDYEILLDQRKYRDVVKPHEV